METPATTFAPVIKFRFGADVRDAEGAGATLVNVILSATDAHAITALGLRFGLFGRPVYAPVERVTAATTHDIELSVTRAEIEKDGLQPEGIRLSGAAVTQHGKRLGKLAQVSFNADTHALWRLVIDRGLGGEVVIPASGVEQISASGVALTTPGGGAGVTLTPWRPDAELREDVVKAIESYNRLRVDMEGVNVTAIDGVVWLRGFVSSDLNRRLIGDLVGEVHGLGELHNELITDPELAAAISRALARDPRTAEERIGVYPTLGRVRLRGAVRTAVAREAAEQLASRIPGVGEVVNQLHVSADANVLPVMAGVTNTEDVVPGGR